MKIHYWKVIGKTTTNQARVEFNWYLSCADMLPISLYSQTCFQQCHKARTETSVLFCPMHKKKFPQKHVKCKGVR